jgi:hypothetical protein
MVAFEFDYCTRKKKKLVGIEIYVDSLLFPDNIKVENRNKNTNTCCWKDKYKNILIKFCCFQNIRY